MARLHGTHLLPLSVVRPRCWGGMSSGESMVTASVTPGRARWCMRHAACGMRHAARIRMMILYVASGPAVSHTVRHLMLLPCTLWWQCGSPRSTPRSTHPRPADARIGSDYVPVVRNDMCHVCTGGSGRGRRDPGPGDDARGSGTARCARPGRTRSRVAPGTRRNTRNPIRINF